MTVPTPSSCPPQGAPSSAVELDDVSPISPIACAFGDEILLRAASLADGAASHARSASECAWRGDVEPLRVHLRDARNALEAARMCYDELEAELAKAAP
jgi:hypothetical protein